MRKGIPPVHSITGNESDVLEDKQVNLSIKVSESLRRHWVSEAKRQGTSLTAEIIEALKNRFGLPEIIISGFNAIDVKLFKIIIES